MDCSFRKTDSLQANPLEGHCWSVLQRILGPVPWSSPASLGFCTKLYGKCGRMNNADIENGYSTRRITSPGPLKTLLSPTTWPTGKITLNVWAGILGDHIIGPYMLPRNVTGQTCLVLLIEMLPELLEDVLLETW
ncbi:hypothetical protein PR048_011189 [Dryococelus australis]|uniref:Uncharacterized protein n=1 Tax=Dryococelus australis TaxID=614101 RepID=A0ABQ9HM71_9NEOP|nr:hypothetical protein PR048_011189 [Dryococelus australis]